MLYRHLLESKNNSNPWDLTTNKGYIAANKEITKEFDKQVANMKKQVKSGVGSRKAGNAVFRTMSKFLDKYPTALGATDTEPKAELNSRIDALVTESKNTITEAVKVSPGQMWFIDWDGPSIIYVQSVGGSTVTMKRTGGDYETLELPKAEFIKDADPLEYDSKKKAFKNLKSGKYVK